MGEKYLKVKEILTSNNQEHLLLNYENFDKNNQEILLDQILGIDFNLINKLYKEKDNENIDKQQIIEPIMYTDKEKLSEKEKEYYRNIGEREIKSGKLAAVTMAGGQGTRLRT